MTIGQGSAPRVSVIVPCRNERAFIEGFASEIDRQVPVAGGFEVIVADGMSNDGTRELLAHLCAARSNFRWLENEGLVVSSGLNLAIMQAKGSIIIRMDVHTRYAEDYILQCVRVLEETGDDCVGGAWRAEGEGFKQKAIALAFGSAFSSGGARSHDAGYEGAVDSVYLGCWRRDFIVSIGLFDEELVRNQDDELNLRILKAGGSVWQSKSIRSLYFPRSSFSALFRQYLQYGFWKVRVIQKHRAAGSIRHVVPALFLCVLAALAVASPFSPVALRGLVAVTGLYVCALAVATLALCRQPARWRFAAIMPFVFACFHLGYAVGFVTGLWTFLVRRNASLAAFAKLTR